MDTQKEALLNKSRLQSARTLNQAGIRSLQEGNVAAGISSLNQALNIIKLVLDSDLSRSQVHLKTSDSCPQVRDRILSSIRIPDRIITSGQDDVFRVFLHALSWEEPTNGNDNKLSILVTGVLLYNMGLAYNLEGLNRCQTSKLARAHGFYAMAHQTFTSLQSHTLESYLLPFLAITNNLGHVHSYFRDFDEVVRCRDELSRRMSVLSIPNNPILLSEDEYMVFFLNVCLFETGMILAPAA